MATSAEMKREYKQRYRERLGDDVFKQRQREYTRKWREKLKAEGKTQKPLTDEQKADARRRYEKWRQSHKAELAAYQRQYQARRKAQATPEELEAMREKRRKSYQRYRQTHADYCKRRNVQYWKNALREYSYDGIVYLMTPGEIRAAMHMTWFADRLIPEADAKVRKMRSDAGQEWKNRYVDDRRTDGC